MASKAERRKFSAADKKRILEEVDRATGRERDPAAGAHLFHDVAPVAEGRDADVDNVFSQKRGLRLERNPLAGENKKLCRQNQRLQQVDWRAFSD